MFLLKELTMGLSLKTLDELDEQDRKSCSINMKAGLFYTLVKMQMSLIE